MMCKFKIDRYITLLTFLILTISISTFANLIDLDSDKKADFIFEQSRDSFLGKGAYKKVYMGKLNNQDVAVVCFNINDRVDDRFNRELEFYRNIQHSNIIRAFAYSENQKLIVLELAIFDFSYVQNFIFISPGFKKISEKSFIEKIILFMDIAKAIQYLHKNRLIHRDIKSNNIVLTKEDSVDRLVAKLIDFDYSIKLQPNSSFFIERVSRGTMGYKAPELIYPSFIARLNKDGESKEIPFYKYSFASDIYALGVFIFNALSKTDFYSLVIKNAQKYGEISWDKFKPTRFKSLAINKTKNKKAIFNAQHYRRKIERDIIYPNYEAIHSTIFPERIFNGSKVPLDIAKDKLIGLIYFMLNFNPDFRPNIDIVLTSLQNIVKTANIGDYD